MKKLLVILGIVLTTTFSAKAATLSTNVTGAVTNNLLSVGVSLHSLTIANPVASATTVTFINSSSTAMTYSYGAFTNLVPTSASLTEIFTTSTGLSQTNTSTIITNVATVVAAATNNLPQLLSLQVPANSTITYTPVGGNLLATRGVLLTTTTNANVTLSYSNLQ